MVGKIDALALSRLFILILIFNFWFLIFDGEMERDEMVGQIDASALSRLFILIFDFWFLIFDGEMERVYGNSQFLH